MARRPALIKKTKKVVKKTKSELYIYNRKYLGEEPTFTDREVNNTQYTKYLYWYNAMSTIGEAKEYLVDYLKNVGRVIEAKKINSIPDKWMPATACWIARMWGRGAKLPASSKEFFESRLSETLSRDYNKAKMEVQADDEAPVEKKVEVKKPTVQDRMRDALEDFIGGVELECDKVISGNVNNFSLYDHMKANNIAPVQAKRVFDFYEPQLIEIEHAYNKTDKGIAEGYQGYTKKQLQDLYDFYLMLIDDAERYQQNEKKARKPRASKPITAEKKLKDFKYQKSCNTNKLQSVSPETIIGASELWVFSTKYNQLTVFRSTDPRGLDVHRTAITNFDVAQSKTKKLKAKDVPNVLNEVLKGGKVTIRKLMDTIKGSDQRLQERMNENTILMRVVK